MELQLGTVAHTIVHYQVFAVSATQVELCGVHIDLDIKWCSKKISNHDLNEILYCWREITAPPCLSTKFLDQDTVIKKAKSCLQNNPVPPRVTTRHGQMSSLHNRMTVVVIVHRAGLQLNGLCSRQSLAGRIQFDHD